jgi:hypothetical protein
MTVLPARYFRSDKQDIGGRQILSRRSPATEQTSTTGSPATAVGETRAALLGGLLAQRGRERIVGIEEGGRPGLGVIDGDDPDGSVPGEHPDTAAHLRMIMKTDIDTMS